MSWILMPKVIGKSGFWCAGLMARPTKKLMSVAFSNSSRAMSEAPSRRVDQLAERIGAVEEILRVFEHARDGDHAFRHQVHAVQLADGWDFPDRDSPAWA